MYTDCFIGRTIKHIDVSAHDEFMLIHFDDNTMWLITAVRWNCSGAKLDDRISFGHHALREAQHAQHTRRSNENCGTHQ